MYTEPPPWILAALALLGFLWLRERNESEDRVQKCDAECQKYLSRAADWIEDQGGDFSEIVD